MTLEFATRSDVEAVEKLIRPYVRRTPILEVDGADFGVDGVALVFKLELMQHSGAFKARGAFANLLMRKPADAGVAAASGGNHGAAVAFAARRLGLKATIFVPETSSPAKIARIRSAGADLKLTGARYSEALDACLDHCERTGALNVHAYDAPETILGAATLSQELQEQGPGLDAVLVPVGGGGLIAGAAAWFGTQTPVIAVEPEECPCLHAALKAGRPVEAAVAGRAADSLGASKVGALNFEILNGVVADSVLVGEAAILDAQRRLWSTIQVAAEPGAATPLAALMSGAYKPPAGARVGMVVSGGNTVAVNFDR